MHKLTITLMLLCLTVFSGHAQEGIFKNRNGVIIGKSNEHIPGTKYEQFTLPNEQSGFLETEENQQDKSTTSVLLEEYFDEWPPVDWSIFLLGNAGDWMLDVGEGAALHTWEDGINKNWLITPQLFIDSDNYKLSLRNWSNGLTDESCKIAISTGSGDPEDGDFVDVLIPANTGYYYDLELFLFQYSGENIYIGFHTTNLASWRIDDVIVAPNSFVDGSLERVVNPNGNTEEGAIETVQVKVKNYGTSEIDAFDVNWSVNGVEQGTFSVEDANISPEGIMVVEVGDYDFSAEGLYTIDAELILDGDANLENNSITGEYSVGYAYDLVLKEISPNGSFPNSGNRNIYFTVVNTGEDVIDQANASIIVNTEEVLNVDLDGLNIQAGSIAQIYIGEYSFSEGLNEITGIINVDFDLNNINNQLEEHYTVGATYEAFQQPEFPPVGWNATWAELDWWFPQFNDSTNTYVQMQGYSDSEYNRKDTLWTPLLQIDENDVLNWRGFFPGVYDIGTLHIIAKDGADDQIIMIEEDVAQTPTVWTDYSVNIGAAAGEKYIGFVADSPSENYGIFRIDDVETTSNMALKPFDLTASNFKSARIFYKDIENTIYCKIMNRGQNDIAGSDYSIDIVGVDQGVIHTEDGINIDSFDERWIAIPFTFTDILSDEIYFEINYASDDHIADNKSISKEISVVPSNTQMNTAGLGDMLTLYAPFNGWNINWNGEDDITQSVYYPTEVGTPGYIYGLIFYYEYCNEFGSHVPLKVWVGETQNEDLEDAWLPYEELTLLYDDVIYIDHNVTGNGALYIPFDTPYFYNGTNNLVFQHYTELPSFYYTNTNFYNQTSEGVVRTRSLIEEEVDYENPNELCYTLEHFPVTSFVIAPDEATVGVISGYVYDENSNPIEEAKVMAEGTGVSAMTNADGYYEMQALTFDEYTITAKYFGYDDLSHSIDLNQAEYSQDFYLNLRPQVNISGYIVGDNDETTPLSDVQIIFDGYDLYGGVSNDIGNFTIASVYGNYYYELTLQKYGYYDLVVDSVQVFDVDLDLGTLIMEEEMIPAHHIIAELDSETAFIDWEEPVNSTKNLIINDIGYDQDGYANEPMEDVWLGNKFTNPGTITLTDVDLRWTIDGGTPQELSVDIFNEEGELLGTSEGFTTSFDSWLTLDLPNLTITGDYYVMVHWKNNPETSHFLGICWDWDFIMPNTAFIKFPNDDLQLLSLFWDPTGQNLPNYAFLIRPHIMEPFGKSNAKEVLSYNIYRGEANDLHNVENWEMLNSEPVTVTDFQDQNVSNASGNIRYAVEAIYSNDIAEVSFSDILMLSVGIEDIENQDIRVYPIPAGNNLNINSDLAIDKIEIFDVTGALIVSSLNNSQNLKLDISYLNPGVYMLNIYTAKGIASKKIIVE